MSGSKGTLFRPYRLTPSIKTTPVTKSLLKLNLDCSDFAFYIGKLYKLDLCKRRFSDDANRLIGNNSSAFSTFTSTIMNN